MNNPKILGESSLNVKKNFRIFKLEKYNNATEMAKDLLLSENYIYQIISMKTDKVPSIPLLEYICGKWDLDIISFFKSVDLEKEEERIKREKLTKSKN